MWFGTRRASQHALLMRTDCQFIPPRAKLAARSLATSLTVMGALTLLRVLGRFGFSALQFWTVRILPTIAILQHLAVVGIRLRRLMSQRRRLRCASQSVKPVRIDLHRFFVL